MSTPTAPSPLDPLVARLEAAAPLDLPAKTVGKLARGAIGPGPLKDVLSGTWLGHTIHPLLTDVVIGTWSSANILDLIGGREAERAAQRLIAVGIAAYGPTALTGATDWADSEIGNDGVRRVGIVHAWVNGTALALYTASLVARRRGSRGRGKALALAGAGVLSAGGYLGGHLAFRQGIGADQTIFDLGPDDWTPAIGGDQVTEGGATAADVGGIPVMFSRRRGQVLAIHDRCSHRGCSLASGEVEDGAVTCPCHGSTFRLADGEILRGPATAPQPAFDVREREGRVEVKRRA
jgi:nitrite reductase/ring-hydroxylating ferredoxin subunit/uncharacterized membrane protein